MPICPKCKEKIKFLRQVTSGIEKCDMFFVWDKGFIDWDNEKFESDGVVRLFYCPECDNELDFNDEQAENFLKEKDELKELVVEKIKKIKENERRRIY